ncbi:hypothetical protein N0V82_006445 [Gnomoniopsis sp. IMI 355080]|nr:hypothetical protein N0V82_006445 [Gnomoniopsis sp. IMI 355080]
MASGAPHLSPQAGNGGARIGRPPQWTDSKARKLARLYVYTTLPVEKIIKAVFPDDSVKKNSAQKTMHKMFGQDPRHLRPANRNEMNNRFKLVHKRSKRDRNSGKHSEQEVGVLEVKTEACTPAFSETTRFSDMEDLRSPQQESIYSGSELASPSTLASMSPTGPIYSAFPRDDLPELPFPPPARNDTVFSTSTEMSTDSVRKIRSRLSVTTVFAKQVDVLMKRLTISGSNDQGIPSPHGTFSDIPAYYHGRSDPVPHPGLSVPGDFIVARRYVQPCSHQKHFAKHLKKGCACWCVISDDISDSPENFYITDGEDWCDRASHVLNGTVEASCADHFGNTPLHLFASVEKEEGINTTLYLLQSNRSDPLAVNNAGQTFLHVLSASWFSRLDDTNAPLYKLLNHLWARGGQVSHAVFLRDVYGRTFFHRLARFVHDPQILNRISQPYTWAPIPRDALGIKPPGHNAEPSISASRRTCTTGLSPLAEEVKEDDVETKRQKLFYTLNQTYGNHALEDEEGRNGLHCLAELDLDPPVTSTPSTPTSPNLGSQKRKRGQSDASDSPKAIEKRAHFLETLLIKTASVTPPDVNHYNKAGYTVLMAFAMHLTDAADKAGTHTARILDLLLRHGARIDMRNREGETALLVAARCGNKNVVTKLLEHGANLHARDKNGRGIMGVLDAKIDSCRGRGVSEYGRLEAVRASLAKVVLDRGGEDEPGFVDEWCWKSGMQR